MLRFLWITLILSSTDFLVKTLTFNLMILLLCSKSSKCKFPKSSSFTSTLLITLLVKSASFSSSSLHKSTSNILNTLPIQKVSSKQDIWRYFAVYPGLSLKRVCERYKAQAERFGLWWCPCCHTRPILNSQPSWRSGKTQLARWATKWYYYLSNPPGHPPGHPVLNF